MQGILVCGYVGYRECWDIRHATYSVSPTWVWGILMCETCLAVVPVGLWGILRCGNVGLWYMEGYGACWAMRHT